MERAAYKACPVLLDSISGKNLMHFYRLFYFILCHDSNSMIRRPVSSFVQNSNRTPYLSRIVQRDLYSWHPSTALSDMTDFTFFPSTVRQTTRCFLGFSQKYTSPMVLISGPCSIRMISCIPASRALISSDLKRSCC